MADKQRYICVKNFGNTAYININYIESVLCIDGKTRICPTNSEGYYEVDEPAEEIMRRILEGNDDV